MDGIAFHEAYRYKQTAPETTSGHVPETLCEIVLLDDVEDLADRRSTALLPITTGVFMLWETHEY
jgi:hypothetical protein